MHGLFLLLVNSAMAGEAVPSLVDFWPHISFSDLTSMDIIISLISSPFCPRKPPFFFSIKVSKL